MRASSFTQSNRRTRSLDGNSRLCAREDRWTVCVLDRCVQRTYGKGYEPSRDHHPGGNAVEPRRRPRADADVEDTLVSRRSDQFADSFTTGFVITVPPLGLGGAVRKFKHEQRTGVGFVLLGSSQNVRLLQRPKANMAPH